ncbi:MAG: hypothetical protein NC324_01005 [Bacteroides sp.]|nr:hypothetical protein [Bacteroides sp.]
MKTLFYTIGIALAFGGLISSCQPDYIEDTENIETDTITFRGLTASRDSACMYDTVVISADAEGENLNYKWQRAKGSLVPLKEDPSKAYFWGCFTCVGWLTVSCTVYDEYGSYTKDIEVFVKKCRRAKESEK